MISAVLDHLWQSTLVALGVGVLVMALREARASVRYGLWLAASVKFLVPFTAMAALGRLLAPAFHPPMQAAPDAVFIEQAAQPFSQSVPAAPAAQVAAPLAHAAASFDPTLLLPGAWALGSVAVVAFWLARWGRVQSARRRATPLALAAPMPVLASPWMREPGLVGFWRPVLLVPVALLDHLTPADVDALVAHEACHLRRRDNLTSAIHMLVEALFWFHPLVWWIGARLIEERERACDEAVVASGHDRAAYASSLLECCRLYLQSPLPCVSGASGSNLTRRVERIMTAPPRLALPRSRKAVLVAVGVCAVASPVLAGWLASPAVREAAAHVAALASKAAAVGARDVGMARLSPAAGAPPKVIAVAQTEAPPPLAAAADPDPEAGVTTVDVSDVSLAPVPNVQVSKASLIPISAQTPAAGALFAATVVAPATVPASLLADPAWVRLPTLASIIRVYPGAADRIQMPGRATMRCHADDRGYLSRCVVLSERPDGLGFGKAALFLQTEFKLRTLAGDGTPVQGHLVDVTIEFTPKYWARIVGEGGSRDASTPQVVRWVRGPFREPYGPARYPWQALSKGLAAEVSLDCKVRPDGYLSDCAVGRETPRGLGFGQQALLSKTDVLRVETRALDGSPMAGRTVEVRYVFNPPCDAMADRDQTPCQYGRTG